MASDAESTFASARVQSHQCRSAAARPPHPGGTKRRYDRCFDLTRATTAPGKAKGSAFQPGRHVLVLACERYSGGERHGFHQGGEILLQIAVRVLLQLGSAEMGLQHLARRGR